MLVGNMKMRFSTVGRPRRAGLAALAAVAALLLAACGTAPSARPVTELPDNAAIALSNLRR